MGGKAGKQLIWMGVRVDGGSARHRREFTSEPPAALPRRPLPLAAVCGGQKVGARSYLAAPLAFSPVNAKTATALMVWFLSRDGRPWRTLATRLQSMALIATCGVDSASARCWNGVGLWGVCLCALP